MKQNINRGLQIVGVVILTVASFFAGYYTTTSDGSKKIKTTNTDVSALLSQMKPGDSVIIDQQDIIKGEKEQNGGLDLTIRNKEDFSRILSLDGLGATEAASKSQGIKSEDIQSGKHEGYGKYEEFVRNVKNFFMGSFLFITVGLLILVILLFVPATAPVAGSILRFLASLLPGIGSFVENIFAKFKFKKPLTQTAVGLDSAKAELRRMPDPNIGLNAAKAELLSQKDTLTGDQAWNIIMKNISSSPIITGSQAWDIVAKNLGTAQDNATKTEITNYAN